MHKAAGTLNLLKRNQHLVSSFVNITERDGFDFSILQDPEQNPALEINGESLSENSKFDFSFYWDSMN